MKVTGRERLHDFCKKHADARQWVEIWLQEASAATWRTPQQIRDRYASASFLADNVVVLNVRGNHYRLEFTVAYKVGVVTINWIGTHREYDERNRNR